MREIVAEIGQNVAARKAWERAVTDHLMDRVSTVNPGAVSEGNTAVDYAKLTKTFDKYQEALAELYAGQPEKMNALRRAQKMLEPLAIKAGAAAVGRPEVSGVGERAWKMLETALKAHYGILKGGGVLRTLKVASSLVSDPAGAE